MSAIPSRPLTTEEAKEAERNSWSEKEFTKQMIALANGYGWRVAHFRTAKSQSGRWLTAVQGQGKGFFDLVMVRGQRIIFAELKVKRGYLSPEQREWLYALMSALAPGARHEVYIWRPEDWDDIARTLSREDV